MPRYGQNDMVGNVHQAKNVSSTDAPSRGKDFGTRNYILLFKNPSVSTYIYKIIDKLNSNNKKKCKHCFGIIYEEQYYRLPFNMSST